MNPALLLLLAVACGAWCALSVIFVPHTTFSPSDGTSVVLSIIISGLGCVLFFFAAVITALVNVIGG